MIGHEEAIHGRTDYCHPAPGGIRDTVAAPCLTLSRHLHVYPSGIIAANRSPEQYDDPRNPNRLQPCSALLDRPRAAAHGLDSGPGDRLVGGHVHWLEFMAEPT